MHREMQCVGVSCLAHFRQPHIISNWGAKARVGKRTHRVFFANCWVRWCNYSFEYPPEVPGFTNQSNPLRVTSRQISRLIQSTSRHFSSLIVTARHFSSLLVTSRHFSSLLVFGSCFQFKTMLLPSASFLVASRHFSSHFVTCLETRFLDQSR